jgi:hypothetical protein
MATDYNLSDLRAEFYKRDVHLGGESLLDRRPNTGAPCSLCSEFGAGDIDSVVAGHRSLPGRACRSVFVVKLLDGRFGVIKSLCGHTIHEGSMLWSSATERSVGDIISKHLTEEEVLQLGLEGTDV